MRPLGISAVRLAADIGLSAASIRRLMRGNRRLTAKTALRLGLFFRMEPRFWTNLQADYDLRTAAGESLKNLRIRVKPHVRKPQPGRI
jgi:antitoxin HigA-1